MPATLLAGVEELISREADLVVVGSTGPEEDPLVRALEEQADMLITIEPTATGTTCLEAILRRPPLKIFAIARDGREGRAVDIAARRVRFDQDNDSAFANAVRQVAELLP
ncbi:hypothetical protein [Sphingosinicella sp. CPCC 101087]|uniref:hypothetical protein n=1 Tax=Sphingosinicella sp. CPCC 101087 TaxID=2497754 RepID=UPI001980ECA9|nr:hypothetical protein [Sphingosinicella sp. CPCC 101087]